MGWVRGNGGLSMSKEVSYESTLKLGALSLGELKLQEYERVAAGLGWGQAGILTRSLMERSRIKLSRANAQSGLMDFDR